MPGSTAIAAGGQWPLDQVIVNLLNNAIKYSPKADKVLVNCEEIENCFRFTVTDYGIGIPADKQPFVFDRFFRVHATAQNFAGLGLGLYISAQIIRRHGGKIGLESSEGNGSRFWFTLPNGEESDPT